MILKAMGLVGLLMLTHSPNTPWADWYNTRKEPDHPRVSCCGVADSFDVDEVEPDPGVPGGLRALVGSIGRGGLREGGTWYQVPPEKIGWEDVNPTGAAVIYLQMEEAGYPTYVLCFFPSSGT